MENHKVEQHKQVVYFKDTIFYEDGAERAIRFAKAMIRTILLWRILNRASFKGNFPDIYSVGRRECTSEL